MAIAGKVPTCPYCGESYECSSDKPFDGAIYWNRKEHDVRCKNHPLRETIYGPPPDDGIETQQELNNFFNKLKKQIDMKQTVIEMTVDSTKQQGYPTMTQHTIECNVPYGQDNIFFRMSGGSTLTLMTINDEAAKLFKVGKKVRVIIEAIEE